MQSYCPVISDKSPNCIQVARERSFHNHARWNGFNLARFPSVEISSAICVLIRGNSVHPLHGRLAQHQIEVHLDKNLRRCVAKIFPPDYSESKVWGFRARPMEAILLEYLNKRRTEEAKGLPFVTKFM
jgi:hypothetical protein